MRRSIRSMLRTSASCKWLAIQNDVFGVRPTSTFRHAADDHGVPMRRGIATRCVAIDAATASCCGGYTGSTKASVPAAPRLLSGRGVAYATDGKGDERIFMVTFGISSSRSTRRPARLCVRSGNGILDLKQNNDQVLDPITGKSG